MVGYCSGEELMPNLSTLTADERVLAKQYNLEDFFKDNKNYVLLVVEMKRILDKRFEGITRSDWARNRFISLAQKMLEHSDPLFAHVNNMHAGKHGGTNIPKKEWKHLCYVSSKIVVHVGWMLDSKK